MKPVYLLSIVMFLALLGLSIYFVGIDVSFYLDPPSLLLIILPAIIMIRANYTFSEILHAFESAKEKVQHNQEELENALTLFNTIQKYLYFSAAIATLMGAVAILSNFTSPKMIGMGFAVALLSFLYVFILQVIVITPMKTAITKNLNHLDS